MTTIATDGMTIAADSRLVVDDDIVTDTHTKLRVIKASRRIYGFAGVTALFGPFVDWFEAGHDIEKLPKNFDREWTLIVVQPALEAEGRTATKAEIIVASRAMPWPAPIAAPWAWGSGGYYAIGAMAHGATPAEAVRAAAKVNLATGGPVHVLSIAHELRLAKAAVVLAT